MTISVAAAAEMLMCQDDILILAHRKPDGDTLGACFGLLYALQSIGKRARVECADAFPVRYQLIYGASYVGAAFTPRFVVTCDVADRELLGMLADTYPQIDLCIDHHKSNTLFARHTLLQTAPAAAEIVYRLIVQMGIQPDKTIATALYTGITTDTGCFRFSSVTPSTLRVAAVLMDCGAPAHVINKKMFDSNSRGRIAVEKYMLQNLQYWYEGKCAVVCLPADLHMRYQVAEDELDGVAAFTRRIEGVLCGITVRAAQDGTSRISMRCEAPLDASAICAQFGGGGHTAAAGCTMHGTIEQLSAQLYTAVGEELKRSGL